MRQEFLYLFLTALAFLAAALAVKLLSNEYPKWHRENQYWSTHGFNVAFLRFTQASWLAFKKVQCICFIVCAVMHVAVCIVSFVMMPQADKTQLVLNSAKVLGVLSILFMIVSSFIHAEQ